jgi:hypothetical protein
MKFLNTLRTLSPEFYVGYIPTTPPGIVRLMRILVLSLFTVMLVIAISLSTSQRQFSRYIFDYGKPVALEGWLRVNPVPHLVIHLGDGPTGTPYFKNILLVSKGKHGAEANISQAESNLKKRLKNKRVLISGSMIFGAGKAILEIESPSAIQLLEATDQLVTAMPVMQSSIDATGEIVDPKCFFGVMKPGESKLHASCAIRCIAGGIPAVLKSNKGAHYLLVDENHRPIASSILPFIGQQVRLSGVHFTMDDWDILQIKTEDLKRLSSEINLKTNLKLFSEGITQCNLP